VTDIRTQAVNALRQNASAGEMVTATASATVLDENGREVALKAGISRVVRDHHLVRQHPDLFGLERRWRLG
jgi:hypothetical protein